MILLTGHTMTPERKIPLESMQLTLKERDSTATIVPADMTGIGVNSWMKDDTEPGVGIVWRVKSISQAYATRTPTVQLEHMINSLKDRIMFGEIKPAQITGNAKATTCTAEQAIRYILSYQNDWVLDRFEYAGVSNPYKFDGDSLFDALETVSDSLRDSWWTYDMSVYPFRLNIIYKPNTTDTEMRAGRNMRTITRTIDKSGMYTRFYPTGKDDLHIPGDYVELNTAQYGVVSKIETDASIDSVDELIRWANERLALHAEPEVSIDVEGVELVKSTGVSLDRMWLGSYCRVPLPEFGTEITERIVSLNYADKKNRPEVVKITLANNKSDVAKIIADVIKNGSGGKGGRTSTKQDKEDHAWFEDTNNHVAMCAIGIIGTDAQGNPNWTRLSRLEVNEDGIYGSVKSVQNGLVIAQTAISENEEAIELEATRRLAKDTELEGRLIVEAGKVGMTVQITDDREIVVNEDGIYSQVKSVQNDVVVANTKITQNEYAITQEANIRISENTQLSSRITQTATAISSEVQARINADNQMSSRITQTANSISAEVTRATAAEGSLSSRITVNAQGIETKVSKNGVISSINQSAESVTINASKINLNGYVTTSMLESAFQSVQQMSVQQMTISTYFTCLGYNTTWKEKTVVTGISTTEADKTYYATTNASHNDVTGAKYIAPVTAVTPSTSTIYYLGR